MKKIIVLALTVQHAKTKAISIIALTSEYKFSLIPRARGQRVGPTIEVLANEDYAKPAGQLPVDSLTIVYGENGEGKTTLLLNVCNTLRTYGRNRPLGIIWRDTSGDIHLDAGRHLAALRLSGPMTANKNLPFTKRFWSVFYTTSPFESARRRELIGNGSIDVTPSFRTNSFNGTSLCRAADSLPRDIPFIRRTKVQLEISEYMDVNEEIQRFTSTMLSKDMDELESNPTQRDSTHIAQLKKLALDLSTRTRSLLAIELRRARLDGPKAEKMLLQELFSRKKPLIGSQAMGRFLSVRENGLTSRVKATSILKAVEELKAAVKAQTPEELLDYAALLSALSPMALEALQEAENLGLLYWNFLELSSGQIALLMLFSSLSAALENLRSRGEDSVALILDEGEMFMHPAWQRKYLNDLMAFIKHYRASFDEIHLILATHSLIVAGDAPPNRLYDVKSGEMRNGFAYGPKEVLTDVYGVEEFSGKMAEALYEKIVAFLKKPTSLTNNEQEVLGLIKQIASPRLRNHLLEQVQQKKLSQYD